jgi:hypothetical protein
MGEVADDMIDGACCSLCGTYFESEHGYPVLCLECWDEASQVDRKKYQKTIFDELE